jgi:hypothetical protein
MTRGWGLYLFLWKLDHGFRWGWTLLRSASWWPNSGWWRWGAQVRWTTFLCMQEVKLPQCTLQLENIMGRLEGDTELQGVHQAYAGHCRVTQDLPMCDSTFPYWSTSSSFLTLPFQLLELNNYKWSKPFQTLKIKYSIIPQWCHTYQKADNMISPNGS